MRCRTKSPPIRLGSVALRFQLPSVWLARPPARSPRRDRHPTPAPAAESDDEKLRRLEAILFLAKEALNTRRIAHFASLADGTEARTLIRLLNRRYDQCDRAFRVEEVAGGFRLLTRPKFVGWLRRLEHIPVEQRLSAPALETLAVVAYRQPVLRADIEAIRGVGCGEVLRQLMDRELVRISGRSEELGRPYLYSTTKTFLSLFGLSSLEQLPRGDAMRSVATNGATDSPGDAARQVEKEPEVTVTPVDLQPLEVEASAIPSSNHDAAVAESPVAGPRSDDDIDEADDDFNDDDEEEEDDFDDDDNEEDDDEEEDDYDDEDDDDYDDDDDDDDDDDEDEFDDGWEEVDDEEDEDDDEDDDVDEDEDEWEEDDDEWEDDEDEDVDDDVDDDDDEDQWEDEEED